VECSDIVKEHGKKLRVGILFGGKSAEHEVSLQSAKNVYDAIDRDKYEPVLIGIDLQNFVCPIDQPDIQLDTPEECEIVGVIRCRRNHF
jgi:D-alanine-D-alanine ligase-like ATP-grasp enzyme